LFRGSSDDGPSPTTVLGMAKNFLALFLAGSIAAGILVGCSSGDYSKTEPAAEKKACLYLTDQIRNADQTGPIDAMETLDVMDGFFADIDSNGDGYELRNEIAKAKAATSEESLFNNFVQMGAYCDVTYRITVD
jgi:hypothetical protein